MSSLLVVVSNLATFNCRSHSPDTIVDELLKDRHDIPAPVLFANDKLLSILLSRGCADMSPKRKRTFTNKDLNHYGLIHPLISIPLFLPNTEIKELYHPEGISISSVNFGQHRFRSQDSVYTQNLTQFILFAKLQ